MQNRIQREQPIPITLLTGFLGAGKTTLLNRILHADHGLHIAVLVNDFGAVNIDSQLVVGVQGETISLANGCICCTIRDDLLRATVQLLESPQPPDYIIVEPSGVSDPGAVARSFVLLRPHIQLDSVICLIDADQFTSLTGRNALLAMDQVALADIILLNKVDLASSEQLERIYRFIERTAPRARVIETTHANAPLEFLIGVGKFDLDRLSGRQELDIHVHPEGGEDHPSHAHAHEHASKHAEGHADHDAGHHHEHTDHTLLFSTWHYSGRDPLEFRAVRRMIERLPAGIYRAKGFVYLDKPAERRGVLQVVGNRVRFTFGEAWGHESPATNVVLIGEPGALKPEELTQRFAACLPGATSRAQEIISDVVEWVRSF